MKMQSVIQEQLRELFDGSSARAPFATDWLESASDLKLEVNGVGAIRFPVSSATVRKLRSVARPARFGQGEATVLDRSVRDTWVIAKSRVKIDGRRWRATLAPALELIHEELALPAGTRLQAKLHDLLVYEEGQFFLAHRDAQKSSDMVGTLVVLLPSAFTGGQSVISHGGEEVVVRGSSKQELTFVAFFADCEHEVKPVKTGHRVALTYELRLSGTPEFEAADQTTCDAIRKLFENHFATRVPIGWGREEAVPDRLVYLLDHEYTQQGLSWWRLKGADGARAATLRQVAGAMDCEIFLATAEVHERWGCESEDYGYGRGYRSRRRRWREEEDDDYDDTPEDSEHPPLVELHDVDIVLESWVNVEDRPVRNGESAVELAELCVSRPSEELTPFRLEHEGYMGNWGDTVDRWYRRAAVVLWPRDRDFMVRGKHAPAWAAARLRAEIEAGDVDRARQLVGQILPYWDRERSDSDGELTSDVLSVAHGLADPELAAAWSAPVSLDRVALPEELAMLVERYGIDWLEARFEVWGGGGTNRRRHSRESREEWQRSLPALVKALGDRGAKVQRWLRRRLEAEHRELHEELERAADAWSPSATIERRDELREPFLSVLRAATIAQATRARNAMTRELVEAAQQDDLRMWAIDVLREACRAMTVPECEQAGLARTADALRDALDSALAAPPRDAGDFSINVDLGCECELCKQLSEFLLNPDARTLDWPLAKPKRQHVHQKLDSLELPVTHTTRRRGSPHTLELRKTDELFARERSARKRMETELAWLAQWGTPAKKRPRRSRR